MLLEKLKQQKSQENSANYLQDRCRLPSEKLFPSAVSYEPQLFIGHSSPNKRASIDCPAGGHQYLPDLWNKQPKTSGAVQLNSHHLPSNRPRSYSQGRAVQHSVNLSDLKSQQHPPFRELPQLPKFKGKPEKIPVVEMVSSNVHIDEIPKICYHTRLDHTTMIAPQYSTSTDEGIEPDLEDAVASSSPTQLSQRLTYPPLSTGSVIKSHSQNLMMDLPCAVNLQYEADLMSSLPSCTANETAVKYADCAVVNAMNSCCHQQQHQQHQQQLQSQLPQSSWDRRSAFLAHNQCVGDGGVRSRPENMSPPVSFREGRRASDGLMNQIDTGSGLQQIPPSSPRSPQQQQHHHHHHHHQQQQQQYNNRITFNNHQKLQDCGKNNKGLAELHMVQKEHETLKILYQSCLPNDEQVRKQSVAAMMAAADSAAGRNGIVLQASQQLQHNEYHRKDVPPRSPSAAMAKRFNYQDGYGPLDKAGLQQQLLHQRLLQHKRTVLQKQGAAAFSQCNVSAAMTVTATAAAVTTSESPVKRPQHHHPHRQPLYNKTAAQLSPQHSIDGHVHAPQLQSDGSWQSLPHTMATCQINDFDSQANWLSVPDPQHHWYFTSGQQYTFSKNYSQVSVFILFYHLAILRIYQVNGIQVDYKL